MSACSRHRALRRAGPTSTLHPPRGWATRPPNSAHTASGDSHQNPAEQAGEARSRSPPRPPGPQEAPQQLVRLAAAQLRTLCSHSLPPSEAARRGQRPPLQPPAQPTHHGEQVSVRRVAPTSPPASETKLLGSLPEGGPGSSWLTGWTGGQWGRWAPDWTSPDRPLSSATSVSLLGPAPTPWAGGTASPQLRCFQHVLQITEKGHRGGGRKAGLCK